MTLTVSSCIEVFEIIADAADPEASKSVPVTYAVPEQLKSKKPLCIYNLLIIYNRQLISSQIPSLQILKKRVDTKTIMETPVHLPMTTRKE